MITRIRRLSIALLAALAVGAGASAPADAAGAVRIALLPVVVHSAESPDYLREGLADMLAARLHGVGAVEVVRVDDINKATSRLPKALAAGREVNADYVLFGSFTRFGQGASLDLQCAATDPAVSEALMREIFVHSSSIGDVIPDLADLVGKVTRFIDLEPGPPVLAAPASPAASPAVVGPSMEELVDRIQALEESVRALKESGSPAEVSLR